MELRQEPFFLGYFLLCLLLMSQAGCRCPGRGRCGASSGFWFCLFYPRTQFAPSLLSFQITLKSSSPQTAMMSLMFICSDPSGKHNFRRCDFGQFLVKRRSSRGPETRLWLIYLWDIIKMKCRISTVWAADSQAHCNMVTLESYRGGIGERESSPYSTVLVTVRTQIVFPG